VTDSDAEMLLYPNPVSQNLKIEFKEMTTGHVSIYSIDGRKLMESEVGKTAKIQLDVSDFETGFYITVMKLTEGTVLISNFIKE